MKKILWCLSVSMLLFWAGTGQAKSYPCVDNFDVERYLGTWYEIARLDHSFERGLEQVTATYSWNENGTIRVQNRGYDPKKEKWNEATGKAKFKGDENVGALKVSFFGPFYAGYNIVELDEDYQHALVVGPNTKYLWVLSRTPQLAPDIYKKLLDKAETLGFDTDALIKVKQPVKVE